MSTYQMPDLVRRIVVTMIAPILAAFLLTACEMTAPDPVAGNPSMADEKMEEGHDGGGDSM
jgi:hypothetical protein